jgi:large subunit ribosomal protein L13
MNYINFNLTPSLKMREIKEQWFVIDADNVTLGKLASITSQLLRGKLSPLYTAHMNMHINVIIINAEKFFFSSNKWETKKYWSHSGQLGGLKVLTATQLKDQRGHKFLVHTAIRRMMTDNTLRRYLLKNLFIYNGSDHPHAAQKPKVFVIEQAKNLSSLL